MTANELPVLNRCVDKLMHKLLAKQDELGRRERSCGTYHDIRAMTRLRAQIASLEKRLQRAERLQESALTSQ